jgi:hypothetical protein
MYRAATSNYDLTNSTTVFFNWDTATVVTNGGVTYTTTSSSTYGIPYFTATIAGLYNVGFDVVFSPTLGASDRLEIWVSVNDNGTFNQLNRKGVASFGPNALSAETSTNLLCNANDTIWFYGFFATSGTTTIENTTTQSWVYVTRVSTT